MSETKQIRKGANGQQFSPKPLNSIYGEKEMDVYACSICFVKNTKWSLHITKGPLILQLSPDVTNGNVIL